MALRAPHRLPGIRFEFQPPPPTDVLPRMDVAVFVGFAASGPLHMPVAVEDVTQFTTIFGGDVPLAWDAQRSEQVYAYLAPAVRAFFRNGGRRCWVVRVAGDEAEYNYFPVPGLALVDADGAITPAFARARSQGSWSDGLRVGTSLSSDPVFINLLSPSKGDLIVDLALESPNDISVGNLLRLTFSDGEYVLMFAVTSVQPVDPKSISSPLNAVALHSIASSPLDVLSSRSTVQVTARIALWFKASPPSSPLPSPKQAVMFTYGAPGPPVTASN